MLEEFKEYINNNYDLNDKDIYLKYVHSLRVYDLSLKYSKILKFNDEETYLASVIALLHDIGRFKQLKEYHSYDDIKTIDHAIVGADLLFKSGKIKDFDVDSKYYDIIDFCIRHHSDKVLPSISDKEYIKEANLIRDIDKIDILFILGTLGKFDMQESDEDISPKIMECFKEKKCADKKDVKGNNDLIALRFTFVYDIYNKECLEELGHNLDIYYKRIDKKEHFDKIYKDVKKYIKERITC